MPECTNSADVAYLKAASGCARGDGALVTARWVWPVQSQWTSTSSVGAIRVKAWRGETVIPRRQKSTSSWVTLSHFAAFAELVSRQASNVGYSLDSLMRASSVVNCQLILALS